MQCAIVGLVCFVFGLLLGLWCKLKYNDDVAYYRGYGNGLDDANDAIEFGKMRMEGKS